MSIMLDHTPHFTIRVWGNPWSGAIRLSELRGERPKRMPIAEIEVDTTEFDGELTIAPHRGLDLINQKMLTAGRTDVDA
jgi:hypothetical protein